MGRRQITSAVTLLVLVGLLVLGAVWGWRSLFGELPDEPVAVTEPEPTCTVERMERGERLRSRQVQVSVFNGGTRSGLAGTMMEELLNRGFIPGDIGNAPEEVSVNRVQVWTTQAEDPEAQLVARQFGRRTRVRVTDQDLGAGVDVIVGNDLDRLNRRAPRGIRLREPHEVCLPLDNLEPLD